MQIHTLGLGLADQLEHPAPVLRALVDLRDGHRHRAAAALRHLPDHRDVHAGDSFELVYEKVKSPDGEVRGGDVLFASLQLRGRNLHAYRYEHTDGSHGYYDADGRSLRKWLMRTPIDGARLSSGFGPRRFSAIFLNHFS